MAIESTSSSALQSPVQGWSSLTRTRSRIFSASVASLPKQCALASKGLLDCGVDGSIDPQCPVDSLDQLYCQAVALSPILIAKVQTWASASCGCFYSAATSASCFQRVGTSVFSIHYGMCSSMMCMYLGLHRLNYPSTPPYVNCDLCTITLKNGDV
jgi:hypothetical protein